MIRFKALAAAAALVSFGILSSTATAAMIGVQLYQPSKTQAGATMTASDSAGVVAQTNWNAVATNSIPQASGTNGVTLADSTGSTSAGVKLRVNNSVVGTPKGFDGWDYPAGTTGAYTAQATGGGKLLNHFGGSDNRYYALEFTGLNPAEAVDIYVYFASNANRTGQFGITDGVAAATFKGVRTQNGSAFNGSYVESTSFDTVGNYVKFANVTPSATGSLFVIRDNQGGTAAGSWEFSASGIQIAAVPEPASLGLLGAGALLLVRRRRTA